MLERLDIKNFLMIFIEYVIQMYNLEEKNLKSGFSFT